jgi:hypothetical protein
MENATGQREIEQKSANNANYGRKSALRIFLQIVGNKYLGKDEFPGIERQNRITG